MGMIKEFRDFAVKGSVADLAIGVIIGAAFSKLVSSLVTDVLTPPLGLLLGRLDFTKYELVLRKASGETAAVSIKYGQFFTHVIDFVIVAFALFLVVKGINRLREDPAKPKSEEGGGTTSCRFCKSTIPAKASRCPFCTSKLKG